MPSLALIVGTRPECIKLAPVFAELRRAGKVRPLLVSTGQHRELLETSQRYREVLASFVDESSVVD